MNERNGRESSTRTIVIVDAPKCPPHSSKPSSPEIVARPLVVQNAVKHSDAPELGVQLEDKSDEIRLTV
jgi:hypothetical protein